MLVLVDFLAWGNSGCQCHGGFTEADEDSDEEWGNWSAGGAVHGGHGLKQDAEWLPRAQNETNSPRKKTRLPTVCP